VLLMLQKGEIQSRYIFHSASAYTQPWWCMPTLVAKI